METCPRGNGRIVELIGLLYVYSSLFIQNHTYSLKKTLNYGILF